MNITTDNEIIEALMRGDDLPFKNFYQKEMPAFISWCKSEWKMESTAAHDLYQDAQLHLYENIISAKLQSLTSSLKTYLYAIGKNLIKVKFRKQVTFNNHEHQISEHLSFLGSNESHDDSKMSQIKVIINAIKEMEEPCKGLLTLFYYDNLSFKLIAERLGYKNDSVAKNQKKGALTGSETNIHPN